MFRTSAVAAAGCPFLALLMASVKLRVSQTPQRLAASAPVTARLPLLLLLYGTVVAPVHRCPLHLPTLTVPIAVPGQSLAYGLGVDTLVVALVRINAYRKEILC